MNIGKTHPRTQTYTVALVKHTRVKEYNQIPACKANQSICSESYTNIFNGAAIKEIVCCSNFITVCNVHKCKLKDDKINTNDNVRLQLPLDTFLKMVP